jgi:periplasmic protein TonB
MFETTAVAAGIGGRRVWTTCAGMTAEAALLASAVLIPLAFPGVLPSGATITTWLQAPAPVRVAPVAAARLPEGRPAPATQIRDGKIYEPVDPPAAPQIIVDEPAPGPFLGVSSALLGVETRGASTLLRSIVERLNAPPQPSPKIEAAAKAEEPATPRRITLGGEVKEAVLLRRVEPVYPPLALRTRISGVVNLEGVIGTDGHIRELKPVSGNPLLVPAAVDAVRRWIYKPTMLDGAAVEVDLMIAVTFRLK